MGDASQATSGPVVEVADLRKQFRRGDGTVVNAIDDVTLSVGPGEFLVLLGPSGCGKTTLLRSIAGLEQPDAGTIRVSGTTQFSSAEQVNVPPERRRISMIFQSYALWPHMTVFDNVAYPLASRRKDRPRRDEVRRRVRSALEMVGIPDLEGQYPSQMSGGQQQRVALARALVSNDQVVLFDEPLSNVDAKVREQLRFELLAMQRALGFSAVFVTHDQTEAMELAHRIAVIDTGRVAQLGTPQEVYQQPATRYVANFIGAVNEMVGRITRIDGGTAVVECAAGKVVGSLAGAGYAVGDEVAAIWRPERGALTREEPTEVNRWFGRLVASMFVGSHTEYVISSGDQRLRLWSPRSDVVAAGKDGWVSVPAEDVRILPLEGAATGVPAHAAGGVLAGNPS